MLCELTTKQRLKKSLKLQPCSQGFSFKNWDGVEFYWAFNKRALDVRLGGRDMREIGRGRREKPWESREPDIFSHSESYLTSISSVTVGKFLRDWFIKRKKFKSIGLR